MQTLGILEVLEMDVLKLPSEKCLHQNTSEIMISEMIAESQNLEEKSLLCWKFL